MLVMLPGMTATWLFQIVCSRIRAIPFRLLPAPPLVPPAARAR